MLTEGMEIPQFKFHAGTKVKTIYGVGVVRAHDMEPGEACNLVQYEEEFKPYLAHTGSIPNWEGFSTTERNCWWHTDSQLEVIQ